MHPSLDIRFVLAHGNEKAKNKAPKQPLGALRANQQRGNRKDTYAFCAAVMSATNCARAASIAWRSAVSVARRAVRSSPNFAAAAFRSALAFASLFAAVTIASTSAEIVGSAACRVAIRASKPATRSA